MTIDPKNINPEDFRVKHKEGVGEKFLVLGKSPNEALLAVMKLNYTAKASTRTEIAMHSEGEKKLMEGASVHRARAKAEKEAEAAELMDRIKAAGGK